MKKYLPLNRPYFIPSLMQALKYFFAGFTISCGFVLYSNEFFYLKVFKRNEGFNGIFDQLTPKELFGKGAKKTFINHQIEPKDPDEIYRDYVDQKIKEGSMKLNDDTKENLQREKDKIENYRRNIFDSKK